MIRWLSQLWVSRTVDRGGKPPRLWRWTFGRFASYRRLALELRQLDGQLKRQAASQQRAIEREHLPVGRYSPRSALGRGGLGAGSGGGFADGLNRLRTAWTAGSLAAVVLVALVAWVAWPNQTTLTPIPDQVQTYTAESFAKVWDPLARQAELTGQALRTQTTQVVRLQERLPEIDRVVSDLGQAIETPIRDEVQRLTHDLRRPWIYLASQLPRLPHNETPVPEET